MDVQKCELRGPDEMSGHARVGPPGFEPGSEAPEAPMLSKLYYEPKRI